MAGDDWLLIAKYPRQEVVRDRNSSGLLSWAAYVAAEPIPAAPDDDWCRLRIVAERIPSQPDQFVTLTMPYFQQDPATISGIRLMMSPWNDPATEATLADETSSIIGAFMPRFASQQVTADEIMHWRGINNAPAP